MEHEAEQNGPSSSIGHGFFEFGLRRRRISRAPLHGFAAPLFAKRTRYAEFPNKPDTANVHEEANRGQYFWHVSQGVNYADFDLHKWWAISLSFRAKTMRTGEPCFGYFNVRDLVKDRLIHTFFHCVWTRGDSLRKQAVAYVDYFSVQRIVACLSSKYAGEDFSCGYAIDLLTGQELDLEVDTDISSDEIRRIYDYEMVDNDIAEKAAVSQ